MRTFHGVCAVLLGIGCLAGCSNEVSDDTGGSGNGASSNSGGASSGGGGSGGINIAGSSGSGANGSGGGSSGSDGCGSNLIGTVRDFMESHPDFEYELGDDRGIVTDTIGPDRKPVYAHGDEATPTTTGPANFNQWFNDVPGVNEYQALTLTFRQGADGVATFEDSEFFPIDGQMFGNEGYAHNYHFTYELHTTFVYTGGETFLFRGDDDVWVYIDDQRVIDIGGVHTAQEASVNLDDLGLVVGTEYPLDFFFAERHLSESNFRIDTRIVFKNCGSPPE